MNVSMLCWAREPQRKYRCPKSPDTPHDLSAPLHYKWILIQIFDHSRVAPKNVCRMEFRQKTGSRTYRCMPSEAPPASVANGCRTRGYGSSISGGWWAFYFY